MNYDKTEMLRVGSMIEADAHFYSGLPLHWSDGVIKVLGIYFAANNVEAAKKNYDETLSKAKNILKIWKTRKLTLLGKITVVNTLIMPLIIYRLQSLQSPNKEFFSQWKKMISEFLWDSKKPKIAYNKLILPYDKGGLKLQHINLRNKALKVKMVQKDRLESDRENSLWSQLLKNVLPIEQSQFWNCNMSTQDVKKIVPRGICRDCIESWAEINYHVPVGTEEILSQVLWYNSHIKENNESLFIKKWAELGMNYVKQIIKKDKFFTCEELWGKFGVRLNYIEYFRLQKAIPKEWMLVIKHGIEIKLHKTGNEIVKGVSKCSKLVYAELMSRRKDEVKSKYVWENKLGLEISDNKWKDLYKQIIKLTNSTKLRFFQYRIINNYLITNKRLCQWKIIASDKCTFCKEETETVMHLLVGCKYVQALWSTLKRWLNYFCYIELEIKEEIIILNIYKGPFADMVNMIILVVKYYVYVQRCYGKQVQFCDVIGEITKYKKIEENIAKRTNMLLGGLSLYLNHLIA